MDTIPWVRQRGWGVLPAARLHQGGQVQLCNRLRIHLRRYCGQKLPDVTKRRATKTCVGRGRRRAPVADAGVCRYTRIRY